jgi:hypothetical protein
MFIHNSSCSLQLTTWPNKLGCYDTLRLPGTNKSLLGPFVNYEGMKCLEYGPRYLSLMFFITYKWAQLGSVTLLKAFQGQTLVYWAHL